MVSSPCRICYGDGRDDPSPGPFAIISPALAGSRHPAPGSHQLNPARTPIDPDLARAEIRARIPTAVANRDDLRAIDMFAAFEALERAADHAQHLRGRRGGPAGIGIPGRSGGPGAAGHGAREIDERAARHHIPGALVGLALNVRSPDGRSYAERLRAGEDRASAERHVRRLHRRGAARPAAVRGPESVRTGGPMQVGIAFAESHVRTGRIPIPRRMASGAKCSRVAAGSISASPICSTIPSATTRCCIASPISTRGTTRAATPRFQQAVSSFGQDPPRDRRRSLREGSSETEPDGARRACWPRARRAPGSVATSSGRTAHEFEETRALSRVFELADARGPRAARRGAEHSSAEREDHPQADHRLVRAAGGRSLSPLPAEFAARGVRAACPSILPHRKDCSSLITQGCQPSFSVMAMRRCLASTGAAG